MPADQQSFPQPMPQPQSQNPVINFNEGNKESIIKVMFNLDPSLIEWMSSGWYDAHVEQSNDAVPIIVPNASFYECQYKEYDKDGKITRSCSVIKPKDSTAARSHVRCSGTKDHTHDPTNTVPKDWRPKLKGAGINFLMGACKGSINSNIGTGNISKTQMDVKKKAELEDRLLNSSFALAYSFPAIFLSDPEEYIADWVMTEEKLPIVFSQPFLEAFMIQMTQNIQANITKGKGMEAARAVMENRIRTENESHATMDYTNPYGVAQKRESNNPLSNLFNFGNKS